MARTFSPTGSPLSNRQRTVSSSVPQRFLSDTVHIGPEALIPWRKVNDTRYQSPAKRDTPSRCERAYFRVRAPTCVIARFPLWRASERSEKYDSPRRSLNCAPLVVSAVFAAEKSSEVRHMRERERMRATVRDGDYVTPHPLRKLPGTRSRPINACHGFRAREISACKKGLASQKADVTAISVASWILWWISRLKFHPFESPGTRWLKELRLYERCRFRRERLRILLLKLSVQKFRIERDCISIMELYTSLSHWTHWKLLNCKIDDVSSRRYTLDGYCCLVNRW